MKKKIFAISGSTRKNSSNEWNVSTTVFSNKPVAIIVASASGEKAFESLYLVMTTLESKIASKSKLLIQGAKGKINMDGAITDQDTLDNIKVLVASLIQSIDEVKSTANIG